jgi:NAD(P)H-dependent flavin oxidoreductase YrpB (nitropropane dioxygenase family)
MKPGHEKTTDDEFRFSTRMMKSFNIGDLKIPVPIIQGGMGIGISLSGLASAVANMGGIGVISSAAIGLVDNKGNSMYRQTNIDGLRREIRKARELTKGILGVNIMSVLSDFSDMVRTSVEEKIDIIFAGAGLPLDLPSYLVKGSKTKLVPIVSSGRAASIISTKWKQNYDYLPDAIVVEGPLAGGHLGFKAEMLSNENNTLEKILADVLSVTGEIRKKYKVSIPVIAAGGIFTGSDVLKFLKKGSSAVQMGTRFVATKECDASDEFKNAFIEADEKNIQIIKSPVGMPGRTIFNNFLKEAYEGKRRPQSCNYHCIKSCNPKTTLYCIAKALHAAYQGNLADGFAFSGANAVLVKKITTVKKVFEDLKSEYMQALKRKI